MPNQTSNLTSAGNCFNLTYAVGNNSGVNWLARTCEPDLEVS